jgi:Na+-transporting methylmalonyl-CoA/oxaloacetate decarboxylase gamma subunit
MNNLLTTFSGFDHLLAAFSWDELWKDTGLPLAIMGMFVVFVALILVRVFIGTLPRIMAFLERFYPEKLEAAQDAQQVESEEIPEAIVAVIAAVVADTIGIRHRIVRTRRITPEGMGWSLEGRLQHHASHRLKPRNPK